MAKVRKALLAAVSAGGAVLLGELTVAVPADAESWAALGVKVLGAAAVAGYAVWRTPNAQAVSR